MRLLLFDLDGTLYKLPDGGFIKSSVYQEMREKSINFLVMKTGMNKLQAKDKYEEILTNYKTHISLGFEKEFNINRLEYFNYAWNMNPEFHFKKNEKLKNSLIKLSKFNKLVVLSDAPVVWISKVLNYLEIENLFDKIFSGEGDIRKENGQYKKVLEFYNILPSNCVMIGDEESKDVVLAKKNGLKAVFVGNTESKFADKNIKDIGEIYNVIFALEANK